MRAQCVFWFSLLCIVGCGSTGPGRQDGPIKTVRTYERAIPDASTFERMSQQVGNERFVKFVIDLRRDEILFFDVNVYELHANFVFAELLRVAETPERLYEFNRNYSTTKPDFILGMVVHHVQQDVWALTYAASDALEPAHVEKTMSHLRARFFRGADLKFLPDSPQQAALVSILSGVPYVERDALYKAQTYRAFNTGVGIGTLRIVSDASTLRTLSLSAKDIVILPEDVPFLPVVAGVITERFSTPLSHVSLRARAWNVPHAGLKDASKAYAALDGKVVRFEATGERYSMREATPEEIAATKRPVKPSKVLVPKRDLSVRELKSLYEIDSGMAAAYGAKTANLGDVAANPPPYVAVPDGFGIPVVWYREHLAAHGLDQRIEAFLAEAPSLIPDAVDQRLAEIRTAIIKAPLDPALARQVLAKRKALGDRGVFVRSSTTAEDLPGFNGAGLYTTVPNVVGDEPLLAAVRSVWASVWNLRAYREREHFGVDQRAVCGAVLVQIGINATAAGVLVTTDLLSRVERDGRYTINAKWGLGIRVVEGKKVPEQIIYDTRMMTMTVISRSDDRVRLVFDDQGGVREVPVTDPGEPVLTEARVQRLALAASVLADRLEWKQPLDIEWLFEGEQLNLVQVRPLVR